MLCFQFWIIYKSIALILMQKTRSILFLREVVEQLDQEDTDQSRNITFRDKDLTLLNEECKDKYDQLTHLVSEKQRLDRKLLELKEQLCQLNPEALEEIERDCDQKNNGFEQDLLPIKERVIPPVSKAIKKKNDKRKKRKERLYYD